jgi:phosphoserine phosphatase
MQSPLSKIPAGVPIVVRLENTLVRSDPLIESVIRYVVDRPLNIFGLIAALWRGWPSVVHEIASKTDLNPRLLPYDDKVLRLIKHRDRPVYLISHADEIYADVVATNIEATGCLASNSVQFIQQAQALDFVRSTLGLGDYAFIGHDHADLPLWKSAQVRVVVRPKNSLRDAISRFAGDCIVIETDRSRLRFLAGLFNVIRSLRGLYALVPTFWQLVNEFDVPIGGILVVAQCILTLLFASGCQYVTAIEEDRRAPKERFNALAVGAADLQIVLIILLILATTVLGILFFVPTVVNFVTCTVIFVCAIALDRKPKTRARRLLELGIIDLSIVVAGVFTIGITSPKGILLASVLSFAIAKVTGHLLRYALRKIVS